MIVLIGESGSGKSLVEQTLKEKFGLKKIISYTTRALRKGEVNGVDYHYISLENFKKMEEEGKLAESTKYRGNLYAVAVEDCEDDSIVVVEPNGFKQLKANPKLNILSFYIYAPKEKREERMRRREDSEESIFGRLTDDAERFKGIKGMVDAIIDNSTDGNIEDVARSIIAIINLKKGELEC
jgi:guanylate kinase